ncbi:MAG TPA: DedA family protein [Planctomycetota bacterium]|nr:DedA family protein [Planctomycetota bacterium]
MTELLGQLVDVFLHLDVHLNEWADRLGPWLYALLFGIVFCETGLVVTPFLPGDSLLFAVGALASIEGSPLSLPLLLVLLSAAAIAGDSANYAIGLRLGPKVFRRADSRVLNRKHLLRTQAFYEKHGGKTIVLARFVPIVRTFAPFVAGIGRMAYSRFAFFNVAGGIAWVVLFLFAGYLFGQTPIVQRNFQFVILGIVLVSVLPVLIEAIRARRADRVPPPPFPPAAA